LEIEKKSAHEREVPYSHLIQGLSPIIFIIILLLDSNVLLISVFLNNFVPFVIRLGLCIVVLSIASILILLSHRTLFTKNRPSDTLVTDGILKYVRNPLYLGILLIYVAFLFLTISLISIVVFVVVFLIYNRMVNYEEKVLESLFGEDYLKYKKSVSKWIPNPFKKFH